MILGTKMQPETFPDRLVPGMMSKIEAMKINRPPQSIGQACRKRHEIFAF